jgi:hypothetical protein
MNNGQVKIQNKELAGAQAALRECGNTRIPMAVALRMVSVQRLIKDRIDDVNEVNTGLVERYGEPQEGEETATQVNSDMPGWLAYVAAFNDLMNEELEVPGHFVLYQDGDQVGWSKDDVNGISLTPNTIVDMAALLRIENLADEAPE